MTATLGKNLVKAFTVKSVNTIERTQVASSNIASVGYDKEARILEIEFHHGAVYQHFDVPEKVYEELMSSSAIGSYFINEIKSKFNYQQK